MKLDDVFKTRTMAKILAAQGQIRKAKAIYTHLLRQSPGRKDIREELDALENKRVFPETDSEKSAALYRQWIKTAFYYYRNTTSTGTNKDNRLDTHT